MWLLPPFRLPFSSPRELLVWFVTGINLWAVGAVALCALLGWLLVGRLSQPRQLGVEQALAGGEGTRGLSYTVEQTGEGEATVTGSWDPAKDQPAPTPELCAALCAALSPEEIYGHSDYLYRAIAGRFFQGKDFTLTITLRQVAGQEDEDEPEPVFTVTRRPGDSDWPQPQCDPAFAAAWREAYNQYWRFGQGRQEEMGPPQSDPIIEEGDLPPESGGEEGEEAPPLPDLDGPGGEEAPPLPDLNGSGGEEDPEGAASAESEPPPDASSGDAGPSSASGSSADGEEGGGDPPEDLLAKLLSYAARFRGLSWEEAWALFWES